MFITLIIGISFGVVLLLIKYKRKCKKANEIPCASGLPFIWNIMKFKINKRLGQKKTYFGYTFQVLNGITQLMYKEKLFKLSGMAKKNIFLIHPETVKEILKRSNLIDKSKFYNNLKNLLNESLLISSGDKWRAKRKLLNPTFHFQILEEFQSIFNKYSNILVKKLENQEQGKPFELFQIVSLCALNIIGETAMGIESGSDICIEMNYIETLNNALSTLFRNFSSNWYSFFLLNSITSFGNKKNNDFRTLHEFAKNIIETREKIMKKQQTDFDKFKKTDDMGIKQKMCFLDLLLHIHLTENNISKEDIIDEVITFMSAGFDSTSVSVCWTLYLLGLHQDIQEKIFDELKCIFNDDIYRCITSEDLQKMKYLECVIKESLRLYPAVPIIGRENNEKFKIGQYEIPPHTSLIIFIYGIHHNPEIYENPEIFDPDRFLPENVVKRDPFSFLPFSAGPRNCIGHRFAMKEMKTICANLLRNFKFRSLDERDKIMFSLKVILHSKNGMRVTIEKR